MKNASGVDLKWRAFPLHPETPPEGRSLEELFAGRPIDIPKMLGKLKRVAREEGLPFGERPMTYNSRLAQELGKWAESEGKGDAFHDAAFRAYFADGRNIARQEVLLGICRRAGLSTPKAREVLEGRLFRDAVDRDWARSARLGVTAVPTFVADGRRLVGAQPYEALEKLVTSGAGGDFLSRR